MESVNNAGALDTILETLMETDDPEASQEAQEKAGELKKKICAIRNDNKKEEKSNKSYLIWSVKWDGFCEPKHVPSHRISRLFSLSPSIFFIK